MKTQSFLLMILLSSSVLFAQVPDLPKVPDAGAAAKAAESAKSAEKAQAASESAAKAEAAQKAAEKASAAQQAAEKANAAQQAASKAEAAQKAAEKANIAQQAASKAEAAQKAAEKANVAQQAASKAEAAQKAAEKANVAQQAASKAEAAQKAAEKASVAQKAAENAESASKAADKASVAQKAADKVLSAQNAAEKAAAISKVADKAASASQAADNASVAQKAAEKANLAQSAADKAASLSKAADKADSATKAADKASVAQASASKAEAAQKAAEKAASSSSAATQSQSSQAASEKAAAANKVAESASSAAQAAASRFSIKTPNAQVLNELKQATPTQPNQTGKKVTHQGSGTGKTSTAPAPGSLGNLGDSSTTVTHQGPGTGTTSTAPSPGSRSDLVGEPPPASSGGTQSVSRDGRVRQVPTTVTDGVSNTIVVSEDQAPSGGVWGGVQVDAEDDGVVRAGSPVPTDGTSNTIAGREDGPPVSNDGASIPLSDGRVRQISDAITDGTSNTIAGREDGPPVSNDSASIPLSDGSVRQVSDAITDGTSNTIAVREDGQPVGNDGASNTIAGREAGEPIADSPSPTDSPKKKSGFLQDLLSIFQKPEDASPTPEPVSGEPPSAGVDPLAGRDASAPPPDPGDKPNSVTLQPVVTLKAEGLSNVAEALKEVRSVEANRQALAAFFKELVLHGTLAPSDVPPEIMEVIGVLTPEEKTEMHRNQDAQKLAREKREASRGESTDPAEKAGEVESGVLYWDMGFPEPPPPAGPLLLRQDAGEVPREPGTTAAGPLANPEEKTDFISRAFEIGKRAKETPPSETESSADSSDAANTSNLSTGSTSDQTTTTSGEGLINAEEGSESSSKTSESGERVIFESQAPEEKNQPRSAPTPATRKVMSSAELDAANEPSGKSSATATKKNASGEQKSTEKSEGKSKKNDSGDADSKKDKDKDKDEKENDIADAYERLRRAESDENDDPAYFRRQGNRDLKDVVTFEAEQAGVAEELKTALENGANPETVRQRIKDASKATGAGQKTSVADDDKNVSKIRESILKGVVKDPKAVGRKIDEIANQGLDETFGKATKVNIADLTRQGDEAKKRGNFAKAKDFYGQAIDATKNGGVNSADYRANFVAEVGLGFRPAADLSRVAVPGPAAGAKGPAQKPAEASGGPAPQPGGSGGAQPGGPRGRIDDFSTLSPGRTKSPAKDSEPANPGPTGPAPNSPPDESPAETDPLPGIAVGEGTLSNTGDPSLEGHHAVLYEDPATGKIYAVTDDGRTVPVSSYTEDGVPVDPRVVSNGGETTTTAQRGESPTPTPASEATPEATPDATPEATPDATPEATPESDATPDPTPDEGGGTEYNPAPDGEGKRNPKTDPGFLDRVLSFFGGGGKKPQNTDPVRVDGAMQPDRSLPIPSAKEGLLGNPGSRDGIRAKPVVQPGEKPPAGNVNGNIDPAPEATPF